MIQEQAIDLPALRQQIDRLDEQIVALYEKRMAIAEAVAEYKIATGKKVLDREREKEKLAAVKALTHNESNAYGATELFEQIMAMSRKRQYRLLAQSDIREKLPLTCVESLIIQGRKIVYQGAEGAYSQEAMKRYFGADCDHFRVDTFRDAMVALAEQKADYAVLPIENSTAGVVGDIFDLLMEFDHCIVGEQIIKIEHCLMGLPGTKLADICQVFSHPQSLMQSAGYLRQHPRWQQIGMQNNAYAASKVQADGDKTQAAIASAHAAQVYGLEILARGIHQNSTNATRFIIVSNRPEFVRSAGKISICFEVAHESGSLYHMLSHFIYNNLNMNRIESRPIAERDWEYRFFIDFDGNLSDEAVINALTGLQEEALRLKILGNY